jgi:hypothetical protein
MDRQIAFFLHGYSWTALLVSDSVCLDSSAEKAVASPYTDPLDA